MPLLDCQIERKMSETKRVRKERPKNPMCIWPNQKGGPCSWQSIKGSKSCKCHLKYEEMFGEEDIPHLKTCSGCKNLFKPNEDAKICEACRERSTAVRSKIKATKIVVKCMGQTQNKTACSYQALAGDTYCEKHQSYKRWKEMTDSGQYVCKNWIRGCFETIDENTKSCRVCRDKEQIHQNTLNQTKRQTALEYNAAASTETTIMCVICNDVCETSVVTNQKCLRCYNRCCKSEKNRNARSPNALG